MSLRTFCIWIRWKCQYQLKLGKLSSSRNNWSVTAFFVLYCIVFPSWQCFAYRIFPLPPWFNLLCATGKRLACQRRSIPIVGSPDCPPPTSLLNCQSSAPYSSLLFPAGAPFPLHGSPAFHVREEVPHVQPLHHAPLLRRRRGREAPAALDQ